MIWLIFGIVIFFGTHLIRDFGDVRAKLIAELGKPVYMTAYIALSLLGFTMMIYGKSKAVSDTLYTPAAFGYQLNGLLVLTAFIFLLSMYRVTNVNRITQHPMVAAFMLWSLGHLLVNGELDSLLFFGSFFLFSTYKLITMEMRSRKQGKVADIDKASWAKDAITFVVAIVLYAVVSVYHQTLFGVPAIAPI